jgi:hypothetical protein
MIKLCNEVNRRYGTDEGSVSKFESESFIKELDKYVDYLQWFERQNRNWRISGYPVEEKSSRTNNIRVTSYGIVFECDYSGIWQPKILIEYYFTGFTKPIDIILTCADLGIMHKKIGSASSLDVDSYSYKRALDEASKCIKEISERESGEFRESFRRNRRYRFSE